MSFFTPEGSTRKQKGCHASAAQNRVPKCRPLVLSPPSLEHRPSTAQVWMRQSRQQLKLGLPHWIAARNAAPSPRSPASSDLIPRPCSAPVWHTFTAARKAQPAPQKSLAHKHRMAISNGNMSHLHCQSRSLPPPSQWPHPPLPPCAAPPRRRYRTRCLPLPLPQSWR